MAQCGQCGAEIVSEAARCPRCGATTHEHDELLGCEVLGRYRVVRRLAEGGMGRVYVAEQAIGTALRRVAIKVLRRQLSDDPQVAQRFAREAETLVRLTHPNTVRLFDFGALADGTLALVMEYVDGHSLAQELARGPLSLARVERILTQIGGALKEAHEHGIVHRDLKPDNVLIEHRQGQADFVKVLDFGIARAATNDDAKRTRLTQQGMMIGTPPYMSPEQFMGESVDARSDIYSLALIAYELLSGRLPFEANTPWEWASKHMTATPAPLSALQDGRVPVAQARALERALAKKAADRPATVDALLAELFATDATPPRTTSSTPTPAPTPAARTDDGPSQISLHLRARRGWLIPMLVAILVAAGALGARLLWPASPLASPAPSEPRPEEPARGATPASATTELPRGVEVPSTPAAAVASAAALEPRRRREHDHAATPRGTDATRQERGPVAASPASALPSSSASTNRADTRATPAGQSTSSTSELRARASSSSPASTQELRERPTASAPSSGFAPQSAAASGAPDRVVKAAIGSGDRAPGPTTRASIPSDLQARLDAIRANATVRPELAVSLFQAASSRYGRHPALQEARELLGAGAEKRIRELLSANRCAQAQALQRALRSASADTNTARLFGKACPLP